MNTLANRIIHFNKSLSFKGVLPEDITIMNPYRENEEALRCSSIFFKKYYSDNNKRRFIIGINPGRFGSGLTGVSFTDPKRLEEKCGIQNNLPKKHEPSSEFIYRMIDAYGGVTKFYSKFYINSVCPLGFTQTNSKGKEVNYNYYDRKDLMEAVMPFIRSSLQLQIDLGMDTQVAYCLGFGKNYAILKRLNQEHSFFKVIVPLEHPRFIKQYKARVEDDYVRKYINVLNG